jgi:Domain of unknown function (DUF3786)
MTAPIREKMIAMVNAQREELRQRGPREFAAKCGAEFSGGMLRVKFYGESHVITFPELEVRVEATNKPCRLNRSSMFFYYFLTADGAPLAGKWLAFRELPGGMFYHQAYQGYSGNRLAKAIDNRVGVFERAAQNLGGMKLDLGNAAFAFDALPRVRVAVVYHAGDEDFPASANVLFDASASHYLPTDALAGVGSALVDRLTGAESKDDVD